MNLKEAIGIGKLVLALATAPAYVHCQDTFYGELPSFSPTCEVKTEIPRAIPPLPFPDAEFHETWTSYNAVLQKTQRWEPLADEIEDRYNIPKKWLSTLIALESTGDPLLMNSDGGDLGLIHMYAPTAKSLGLRTHGVFTKGIGKEYAAHGFELRGLLAVCDNNLNRVSLIDQRANPYFNIDAVARYMAGAKEEQGSWTAALHTVHGKNRPTWKKRKYKKVFDRFYDDLFANSTDAQKNRAMAEADFNRRNNGLTTYQEYKDAYKRFAIELIGPTYLEQRPEKELLLSKK